MTRSVLNRSALVSLALLGLTSLAQADLSQPLASGSISVTSQSLYAAAFGFDSKKPAAHYFDVTIDYAVFAPGTFGGDFTLFSGGINPNDYTYVYQVHNYGSAALSKIGVDLAGGRINAIGYDAVRVNSGLASPSNARFSLDSFAFSFSDRLTSGQSSSFLLLSSPDKWAFTPMSILNGGLSASASLIAPMALPVVPVPSAAVLIVIGLGTISTAKSRLLRGLARARCV